MAQPKQRSGGYAKGRAKRQEIIEAATVVFGELGYPKTSMIEIAERCSLSRAGLAHHFPTKESVLSAVLAWRDTVDTQRFRRADAPDPDGPTILRALVEMAAENTKVPGLVGMYSCLAAEAASPSHPAHDYFVRRYDMVEQGIRDALEDVRRSGGLRPEVEPAQAAISIVALMDGLQVYWLLRGRPVDMAAHLRSAISSMLTVEL